MKKRLTFTTAVFLISLLSFGQLTGIKNIPGDYSSVAAAISALNTLGVGSGGVTFNVTAGYTESFPALTSGLITANSVGVGDDFSIPIGDMTISQPVAS